MILFCHGRLWANDSEKIKLTVIVCGRDSESKLTQVKSATVEVKGAGHPPYELPTNGDGKAVFKQLTEGTIEITITGQETEQHWATGSCRVDVTKDTVVGVRLDLQKATHECSPLSRSTSVLEKAIESNERVEEENQEQTNGIVLTTDEIEGDVSQNCKF